MPVLLVLGALAKQDCGSQWKNQAFPKKILHLSKIKQGSFKTQSEPPASSGKKTEVLQELGIADLLLLDPLPLSTTPPPLLPQVQRLRLYQPWPLCPFICVPQRKTQVLPWGHKAIAVSPDTTVALPCGLWACRCNCESDHAILALFHL